MFSEQDKVYQIPEKLLLEKTRGGFAKRVFVVTTAEADQSGNLDFLKKILLAAGLEFDTDTLYAEIQDGEVAAVLPLLKEKQPEFVLVFGVSPAQIGLNIQIPLYQPMPFYGTTFLFSDKLSLLEPDKTRKTNLWQALRQLFL